MRRLDNPSSSAALPHDDDNDEADYMSESFLSNDIRPGIASRYAERRIMKIEAERYEKNEELRKVPKVAELEKEMRKSGLAKPVGEDSKGFALLTKMGYKPGMSIGKKKEGMPEGIKEPIEIDFKTCRTGLGHRSAEEAKQKERAELHMKAMLARSRAHQFLLGDFRKRKRTATVQKQIIRDVLKSRKACQELDLRCLLEVPQNPFFWPIYRESNPEDEERPTKRPAARKDDFLNGVFKYSNGKIAPAEAPLDEILEEELLDKLEDVTAYLRSAHRYCIWCGCQFETEEELRDECPGDNRDAHEGDDL